MKSGENFFHNLWINFVDDLCIMSIMAVDILNSIQKKYKIEIPEEMFGEFDCLDSIVELVQKLLEEKVKPG